jgi:hypothetical protein
MNASGLGALLVAFFGPGDVSDWTIRRDIRKEKLQKELYRKYVLKQ